MRKEQKWFGDGTKLWHASTASSCHHQLENVSHDNLVQENTTKKFCIPIVLNIL